MIYWNQSSSVFSSQQIEKLLVSCYLPIIGSDSLLLGAQKWGEPALDDGELFQTFLKETYQSASQHEVVLRVMCSSPLCLAREGEGRLCVDAAWGVCKPQDLIRSGEATAVVIIAAQSFSMVDDLAEEMKMANGIDEFSSILAELAFMGSCEHVQTLFAATMLTVSQLVANEEKLLPDMASPLLELLKRCTKSMRQGTSGGSMRAEMFDAIGEVCRLHRGMCQKFLVKGIANQVKAALGLNLGGLAMAGCLRCLGNLAKGDPSGKTSHGLASDPALMRDVVQLMGGQDQRCSFEACNLLVLLVDSNAETFSTLVPTVDFQHGGVKLLTGVLDFFTNMEDERLKGYSTLEGSVCGICRAVHHFLSSGLESILNVMDDRGEGKGSELPYSDLVFLIQACASLVSTFPHMWMAAMFAVRSMTIVAKIVSGNNITT